MNAAALQIYSYLLRVNIPFTRFCHPAYQTRTQWKQGLKKSKLEPDFPICDVLCDNQTKKTVLYLHAETDVVPSSEKFSPAKEAELQALCQNLCCEPHTLSPLGLLFDIEKNYRVIVTPELQQSKLWCLSPCSDTSSVLLTPDAFLEFLSTFI